MTGSDLCRTSNSLPADTLLQPARRPATRIRDPYLDLIRAVGTLAVMVAHWLMPQVSWDGESLEIMNVLGSGPGWLITWFIQVIPVMVFVAGAACLAQMRARPTPWWQFMRARVGRILPPIAVFLAVWLIAARVLPLLGVPAGAVQVAVQIAPQMLWYMGIYVMLLMAAHPLRTLYERYGLSFVALLGTDGVVVDLLRFQAGLATLAWANLFLVWAFAFVLGFAYTDRAFSKLQPRMTALIATLGLGALIVATTVGPYPASMVGMAGDAFSNMGPPTVCLIALTLVQVFGTLTFRAALVGLAQKARCQRVITWISARSMTLYLWHLSAMFIVIGVILLAGNADLPRGWSLTWWLTRPLWFATCLGVLLVLVTVFAPIELRRRRPTKCG